MGVILVVLSLLLLTYIAASVPIGVIVTTLYGGQVDIRSAGSGNIGATNVARVTSWQLAMPVLVIDVAKGLVPVLLAPLFWSGSPDGELALKVAVAAAAFGGHCFSLFLSFRGGKGVATGAGAMAGIAPLPTLLAALTWVGVLLVTKRSSVAALLSTALMLVYTWWLTPELTYVVLALAMGIAFRHATNIRRMMKGEEPTVVPPVHWGETHKPSVAQLLQQRPDGRPTKTPLEPDRD